MINIMRIMLLSLLCSSALAQTYPSPTFDGVTIRLSPGALLGADASGVVGAVTLSGAAYTASTRTLTVSSAALSPATSSVLGGVKIGANISVAADGTISVSSTGGGLPTSNPTFTGVLAGPVVNLTGTSSAFLQQGGTTLYQAGGNTTASSIAFGIGSGGIAGTFNTAFGTNALPSATSASGEVAAFGQAACGSLVSGVYVTCIGQHALGYDTTSSQVTALGNDTARNATNLTSAVLLGNGSGEFGSPAYSVTVGSGALQGNSGSILVGGTGTVGDTLSATFTCTATTGYTCSFAGSPITATYTATSTGQTAAALASGLSTAINASSTLNSVCNVPASTFVGSTPFPTSLIVFKCIGTSSTGLGIAITTSVSGAATETLAVGNGVTGQGNMVFGQLAMAGYALSTGNYNFAAGKYALANCTTCANNIAITGINGGQYITTGNYNILLGNNSVQSLTTGSKNIVIGGLSSAPTNLTTGGGNILLQGNSTVDVPSAGTSDWLNIGGLLRGKLSSGSYALALGSDTITSGAVVDASALSGSVALPTGTASTGSAGFIRYNGTAGAVQVYQGGAWVSLAASSATLGSAAGNPVPYSQSDATTGLYSTAAGTVQVSCAGVNCATVTSAGINVPTAGVYQTNGSTSLQVNAQSSVTVGSGTSTTSFANASIGVGQVPVTRDVLAGYQVMGSSLAAGIGSGRVILGYQAGKYVTSSTLTLAGYQAGGLIGGASAATNGVGLGNSALYAHSGSTSIAIGQNALYGNSSAALVGGTITTGDTLSLTFTGTFTGSPVTVSSAALTGTDTLTTAADALKTAVNANGTLAGANITAVRNSAPNGNVYVSLLYPGNTSNGYAITTTGSVTGAATETLTISAGATGAENIAIGVQACSGIYGMTTASDNVCVGKQTLQSLTTGGSNVAIGAFNTGLLVTSGASNTLYGSNNGNKITTGSSNVVLGPSVASTTLATGSSNILIGTSSGVDTPAATTSSYLNIGNAVIASLTKPTISSGFGTTPSVVSGTSSRVFTVNVGTGGTASSGVIAFAVAAPNGYACWVTDTTNPGANRTMSQPTSTTTATFTNYAAGSSSTQAWSASDVLAATCEAY